MSLIGILVIVIIVFSVSNNLLGKETNNKIVDVRLGLSYTSHTPVSIDGNNEFLTVASNEAWPGSGTSSDPIIISGYSFSSTNTSERLINIINTDLYFRIEKCLFQGGYYGILLENVANGNISSNIFSGATDLNEPITVQYSLDIYIVNNTIEDRQNAVKLKYCNNTVVEGNDFDNIDQYAIYFYRTNDSFVVTNNVNDTHSGGIILAVSQNNTVKDNFIRNYDIAEGILLSSSNNCTVNKNDISGDNTGTYAIHLRYSSNNSVADNLLFDHNNYGLYLESSDNILVKNNTIHDNVESQIYLETTYDTVILNNSIYNDATSGNGIVLTGSSNNNSVMQNALHDIDTKPLFLENSGNNTVQENVISDSYYGIYLSGVSYHTVSDNLLYNLGNYGLYASHLKNSTINNNSFDGRPIYLTFIESSSITNNIIIPPSSAKAVSILNCIDTNVTKNKLYGGIDLIYNCSNVNILSNIITNANFGVQILYYSSYVTSNIFISSNTIINSTGIGISIEHSSNNHIINNTLKNNSVGLSIDNTGEYNYIINNSILQNRGNGIYLGYHCNNNEITTNNITLNDLFGIQIDTAGNNKITWNNFLSNNGGNVSQALDDYSYTYGENFYDFNYWDTWISPDDNNDGIVDEAYEIIGNSGSVDKHPLAKQMKPEHFLTEPQITYPNSGETIRGNVTVVWLSSVDSLNHNITYTLVYQEINDSTWLVLAENISTTSYTFDTLALSDGSYNLRVIAYCSNNLSSFTDVAITIQNHLLSQPTFLSPVVGETISGFYLISWQQSIDTFNHSVTYSLLYSDDQINWSSLSQELDTTTYLWNTTAIPNGDYWLKVIATCLEGLSNSSIISFTIENIAHNLSRPEITVLDYVGSILTIEWNASLDSFNHSVFYSVFYFQEGKNESLTPIVVNTTSTSTVWNTSEVPAGTYYVTVVAVCSEGLVNSTTSSPIEVTSVTTTVSTITTTTVPLQTNNTSTSISNTTSDLAGDTTTPGWEFLFVIFPILFVFKKKEKN
ncbi:MAG: NosD domain-containing protein [Candidatus Hodarchaeales archaeon]